MAFVRLSLHQRSLIETYVSRARKVAFLGIDRKSRPVIQFEDVRGVSDVFAIPKRGDPVGAADPLLPLRSLTAVEQDLINPDDHELLFGLHQGRLDG